jgi:hypothetical protein
MINDDDFIELHIDSKKQGSCFFKLLSLFWLPFLIFLGVIAGFLGYLPLKVEIHSVVMIGFIFIIYLYFIKHNAHYGACKFRRKDKELQDVLSWYISNNRLTIGDITKANAPIETFLKDFTANLRNDNFSSVAASIFPTLGILGTFISIAITMPDFSSQDSAMLEKEISLLLGGVGTAFYVSIYGIFLSLWWIYFEKTGMSSFEKNISAIKENIRHRFWTKEEIEQIHFGESLKNFEKLNSIFEKITSNEFIESIQDTLQQRLQLFDNIIQNEQKVLQKSTQHFNQLTKVAEKSIEASEQHIQVYENIALRVEEFTNHLQDNSRILSLVHKELSKNEGRVETISNDLNQSIEKLNRSLSTISADNVKELYVSVLQNIEMMKNESKMIGVMFNKHLDDFDEKYTKKLRESLELIDSESAKIISQIAKLKDLDTHV